MASIHKLSVRGIRAFSPEDEEQVISFCFPLTIIVGANGCGKTTIIEALKYAITGSLPPGNKSGQAFVHDPKNINSTQVKAAVKLRFCNRAGKSMVVVRSMELTQKKTNMTFKQLDGILRTTDEKGNKVSLSHKCSELDRQIPQLLGVSKPILEHVVFCHQEESSWPLMEGSVLKKRFDAIFDSTKYVKALEAIKDTRKKYQAKVKELKIELGELSGHKHAAVGFRNEMDKCRQKDSELHDEIQEINAKMQIEMQKCQSYEAHLDQVEELSSNFSQKKKESDTLDVKITTLKKGLLDDMTESHSLFELEQMKAGFGQKMNDDTKQLQVVKDQMNAMQRDIADWKEKKIDLTGEKGLLMGEKKLHEERLVKRVEMMEELASTYGLELSFSQLSQQSKNNMSTQMTNSDSNDTFHHDVGMSQGMTSTLSADNIHLTEEDLEAFRRSVENKRSFLERDLEECRSESRKADDKIQTELSNLKAQITTIETEQQRLAEERTNASKEMNALPRSTSRTRKNDIDDAKNSAARFAQIRDKHNNNPRRKSIPREISEKEQKISKLKCEIEDLNGILKELRKCAEEQNNIKILERQLENDLELVEEQKQDHDYLLQKYDIKLPDIENWSSTQINGAMDSILDHVTNEYDTIKTDYENAMEEQKKSSDDLSKKKALLSHNQETLAQRRNQLDALTKDGSGVQLIKKVMAAVEKFEVNHDGAIGYRQNSDPQQMIQYFTQKMEQLSRDEAQPDTVKGIIAKLRKLSVVKGSSRNATTFRCPCCTRSMNTEELRTFNNEMIKLGDPVQSDLIKKIEDAAKSNRSALTNYENWRNILSRHINDWMNYRRISDEIEGLKVVVMREEEDLSHVQSKHNEDIEKVESLKEEQRDWQQMHELARRLRDDIGKIANKKYQISTKKDELKLIAPRAGGKDLNATEKQMSAKTEEKDALSNNISELNKELSELNENINNANISATRAEKLVRDKENQFAQEQQNITKRKELTDSVARCKREEVKLQNQIDPIRKKVSMKESEKVRSRSVRQAEVDKKSDLCNNFKNDNEKINSITEQIDEFQNGDKLHRFEKIDTEINNVNQEVMKHEEDFRKMGPKLKKMQDRVSNEETHCKNVERNIELLEIMSIQKELSDELELLREELKELNRDEIDGKHEEAQDIIRQHEREIDKKEGHKASLKTQQRDLSRKLKTAEYKDIDERHRVKMIETETSNMTVQDLDLYHSALDKALLRFHGIKIQEINKIIKELWALTYRGEDITNIRLTSDQDSSSRSTRSYNYRVVMTKGTTELDMRGRCSAGQRVLASIVIRLALAETFCLNCGVMALDEPTTNLDFANKRGLAIALAQIIAQRAAQDNFQLVIITHDEDFVAMMKNELSTHTGFSMPERYFQVSRQEGNDGCYYSKIHCIDWDEL